MKRLLVGLGLVAALLLPSGQASAHSYYSYTCMYIYGSWQITKVLWVANDAGFNHTLRQNHAPAGYWPTGGYCG